MALSVRQRGASHPDPLASRVCLLILTAPLRPTNLTVPTWTCALSLESEGSDAGGDPHAAAAPPPPQVPAGSSATGAGRGEAQSPGEAGLGVPHMFLGKRGPVAPTPATEKLPLLPPHPGVTVGDGVFVRDGGEGGTGRGQDWTLSLCVAGVRRGLRGGRHVQDGLSRGRVQRGLAPGRARRTASSQRYSAHLFAHTASVPLTPKGRARLSC